MNEDNNQSKGSAKLYGDFNIIVFIKVIEAIKKKKLDCRYVELWQKHFT